MKTLIHFGLCPFSRSIRIALKELGEVFEEVDERPWEWRSGFLEINPAGSLPVLQLSEGATVVGVYAIAEFLAERADGQGSGQDAIALFPGDLMARAEVRRLVDWFHRKLHAEATEPLLAEKVYKRFRTGVGEAPDTAVMRAVRHNLNHTLDYVDHLAASRTWLAGGALSFADMAAAGHVSVADYLGEIDWAAHEGARGWYARAKSRPSVHHVLGDRVAGVAPPPQHYADPDF